MCSCSDIFVFHDGVHWCNVFCYYVVMHLLFIIVMDSVVIENLFYLSMLHFSSLSLWGLLSLLLRTCSVVNLNMCKQKQKRAAASFKLQTSPKNLSTNGAGVSRSHSLCSVYVGQSSGTDSVVILPDLPLHSSLPSICSLFNKWYFYTAPSCSYSEYNFLLVSLKQEMDIIFFLMAWMLWFLHPTWLYKSFI